MGMTVAELATRITALENAVEQLKAQVARAARQGHWWHESAGRFANDPVFDEIVRLGREYRESLRPGRRRKPRKDA
jgi:hypothetical protein